MSGISESRLFLGITEQSRIGLLNIVSIRIQDYSDGEIIALEGDPCTSIGIILDGEVIISQSMPSGKRIILEKLQAGENFGEVIIFSDHSSYPASVEAVNSAKIAFISKENVLLLCKLSDIFVANFIGSLSEKILLLNLKVRNLSLQSPLQKTIHYLLENYKEQNSYTLRFDESRLEMAEKLNLPRPSLSRELIKMKAAGWIDFCKNTIQILDLEKLEEIYNDR